MKVISLSHVRSLAFIFALNLIPTPAVAEVRLIRAYCELQTYASAQDPGVVDLKRTSLGAAAQSHARSLAISSAEAWADLDTTLTADGFSWSANTRFVQTNSGGTIPFSYAFLDIFYDIEVLGQDESVTNNVLSFIDSGPSSSSGIGTGYTSIPYLGQGNFFEATEQGPLLLIPGSYRLGMRQTLSSGGGATSNRSLGVTGAVHFTNFTVVPGATQNNPILGEPTVPPVAPGRIFTSVPARRFYDPPLAQGYTFTATGTALFKEIMAFPAGIPAEYYVTTEGSTYGPFEAQQSVNFETLHGHAVDNFVVKGIKPFVDATSPVAFPIMLDFTEELADFTMIPIAAPDVQLVTLPNGDLQFTYVGVLQSSPDLNAWTDVTPAPASPYVIPKAQIGESKFFRASKP